MLVIRNERSKNLRQMKMLEYDANFCSETMHEFWIAVVDHDSMLAMSVSICRN